MTTAMIGALCFGLVIGWVTYRTLRRRADAPSLADISAVIGAVGGAGVTALFKDDQMFGWYSIGLAIGFFLYFAIGLWISGPAETGGWMARNPADSDRPGTQ